MDFRGLYKIIDRDKYYVFSSGDILLFYPEEKRSNIKKAIHRWKRKGWICALKRGLYELTFPKDFIVPDMYVANRLYSPSYVSLETALSNYSIIPEVSMAVTSITPKTTRRFTNKHGLFIYRTVRPEVFNGYYVQREGDFDILIAEPEKALVDFIYFKTYRGWKVDLSGERLDREVISHLNKRKLNRYARLYNISLKEVYAYL